MFVSFLTLISSLFRITPCLRNMTLLAGGGSAALLIGAYGFQMLGYNPCILCYWQRYPHFFTLAIALLILLTHWRFLAYFGATLQATSAALAIFHSGVEWGLWKGLAKCGGQVSALEGLSGADLLATDITDRIVRCDEASWVFLGLSMAGWNAVFSLFLMFFWFAIARAESAPKDAERPQKPL